jgi:L-threonylcarbamoyladenylate synthase
MSERGTDIARAADVLRAGGLVAFPTETVYGLGADAAREDAVARVYAVKGRPRAHPLIVHLAPEAALDDWAVEIPDVARALAAALWPGPLTLILKKSARVASATTGGSDTVGLRKPAHPLAQALLRAFGGGVAAPSANRFGAVSPTTADHVAADLGTDVDYILDGGPCEVGVESTIVDLSRGRAVLLRPGGAARDVIEAITGPLASADRDAPAAPGTLASHYAPRARVIAVALDEVPAAVAAASGNVAVLAPASAFARWPALGAISHALPDDVAGMARDLYAALRDLDARGVDLIVAALPPEAGLGEAVADRLRRAAGPQE